MAITLKNKKFRFIESEGRFSGSLVADVDLLPCPFCGCREAEVENTHTPSYSVQCQTCWAQAEGQWDQKFSANITSEKDFRSLHSAAFRAAVKAWNRRESWS